MMAKFANLFDNVPDIGLLRETDTSTDRFVGGTVLAMLDTLNGHVRVLQASVAPPLLKLLLYIKCVYPDFRADHIAGFVYNQGHQNDGIDYALGANQWPLSDNNGIAMPIMATVMDLGTVMNQCAGRIDFAAAVANLTQSTWSDTTCVVPVTQVMRNDNKALALWILIHMEYPYQEFIWGYDITSGQGTVGSGGHAANPVANLARIPGVRDTVLMVYVDFMTKTGGPEPGPISVNTTIVPFNDEDGVNALVDIEPALLAFIGNPDLVRGALGRCMSWWFDYYGNEEDFRTRS
jgi:hypothetical protein